MEETDRPHTTALPVASAEYLARHEAINIALLDIAALERIVEESQAPIPLDLLRSLEEDFRSLDDLHRQLSTGLEECSIAKSQLAHQVEEEQKDRAQKLEDEKKSLESENKKKLRDLKRQMKDLATEVFGIDEEIKNLREEALHACEVKRNEKKKYEECVTKLNELLKDKEKKREAEETATKGLQELEENCLKLNKEIQELKDISKKEEEEYEKQKEECEEKIGELSRKLGVQQEENLKLTTAMAAAADESERLHVEATALEAEVAALGSQLAHVETQIQEAHTERDRQNLKKEKIEKSIRELKEKITELEERDKQFQKETITQISQMEKQIEQRGADLEKIYTHKANLQEELERTRSTATAKEAEAERLRLETERLEADVQRREGANVRARADLQTLRAQLEEVREMEMTLLAEAEVETAQLRESAQRARAQLEPAKARLRQLRTELNAEQRRSRIWETERSQQLRMAKRRQEVDKGMIGGLESKTQLSGEQQQRTALHCALLLEADRLAHGQHAQRMEAYSRQFQALGLEQRGLQQSIAELELTKELLDKDYSRERHLLDELLDDIEALSETARALKTEEKELEQDILDINVALGAQRSPDSRTRRLRPPNEALGRF